MFFPSIAKISPKYSKLKDYPSFTQQSHTWFASFTQLSFISIWKIQSFHTLPKLIECFVRVYYKILRNHCLIAHNILIILNGKNPNMICEVLRLCLTNSSLFQVSKFPNFEKMVVTFVFSFLRTYQSKMYSCIKVQIKFTQMCF